MTSAWVMIPVAQVPAHQPSHSQIHHQHPASTHQVSVCQNASTASRSLPLVCDINGGIMTSHNWTAPQPSHRSRYHQHPALHQCQCRYFSCIQKRGLGIGGDYCPTAGSSLTSKSHNRIPSQHSRLASSVSVKYFNCIRNAVAVSAVELCPIHANAFQFNFHCTSQSDTPSQHPHLAHPSYR